MPRLLAPSVSRTTISGTYPPAPGAFAVGAGAPGAAAAGVSGTSPTGATLGSTSAMASSDLSMAAPIAVPDDVDRASMADVTALRSVVGGTASWAAPANT